MHAAVEEVLYCGGRNRRAAVEEQSCVLFSIAALLLWRPTTLRANFLLRPHQLPHQSEFRRNMSTFIRCQEKQKKKTKRWRENCKQFSTENNFHKSHFCHIVVKVINCFV